MSRLAGLLLLVALTLTSALAPAGAEALVTALSHDRISITSNFTGTQVVVFGSVERDTQTVPRAGPYELVVTVTGPLSTLVTRRKDRTFGVWINSDSERMERVPSFLAVQSTAPLDRIASTSLRAELGLGLEMLPINAAPTKTPPVHTDFESAFLRLMQQSRLYSQTENAVEFLSPQLFRTSVVLPANVPVGPYTVTVYLFRDGALLASTEDYLVIGKVGFEQLMTRYARQHGFIYGLGAVAVACLTGWLAGIIFRRD